ncbi:MAG: hypothetical protein ACK5IQ_01700 [Bacteroidales bacterium]
MKNYALSKVEDAFFKESEQSLSNVNIPYVLTDNFPKLGLLAAMRFIEWVADNPDGVISLPTGKTPEFFIKWTQYILKNWDRESVVEMRNQYNIGSIQKPSLSGLQFVQIDEFYPINPEQANSFYKYVNNYYIKGFGLDKNKALLINPDEIPLAEGKSYSEIFPNLDVDLSLRYRAAQNKEEELQQKSILMIDDWCTQYEMKIREKGGIGFFLGGIGPDGHIAFNVRGSDHFSTTRLTPTNFETQAVAAGDLGGIEVSRKRLVITIGLETITYNPDAVAIVFAAGEAKAEVVKNAIEGDISNEHPATVLSKLKNGRFYLTRGAAKLLTSEIDRYYQTGEWTPEKSERAIFELCKKLEKYGEHLTLEDLQNDKYTSLIPNVSLSTVEEVMDRVEAKIVKGFTKSKEETYFHTGPHHDDIMLGLLPIIARQLREPSNKFHFSVLTSGFTAVTNSFVISALNDTLQFISDDKIQMLHYSDFFVEGYKHKWDKDIYHYLTNVASDEEKERHRGLSHRLVRNIISIYGTKNKEELVNTINEIISILQASYDGEKNPVQIQKLKGMIREFEEELVWAHYGVQVHNVSHLRLGFYQGDLFTEQPEKSRDVVPILEKLRELKPTVISLAMDPEGSGPDTHYKVLQAIAMAVEEWGKETDLSNLKIHGYRNVWFKFHPSEAEVFVPVSLNTMSTTDASFTNCYLSQVNASFPSYMHDGKFSTLAQNIWVEQLDAVQLLLGKDYFYMHPRPLVRASHGMLFYRELNVKEFLNIAKELEKSVECAIDIEI